MADEIEWTPIKVRLGDLSHWADNPVTLTKAQAGKLLRSKEKLGKMQTLAIGPSNGNGKYPLYDGHQRANVWGAAFGMGLEVWALQSSRALTDDERHAVPIMLRTAVGSLDWDALAGWTDYPISEWGLDDDALQGLKFDIAALGNLLESETPEPADAEPQIDRAEELNEKWQVKAGDLWRIGEHRLLCGDSTRREDVERAMQGERATLLFTSPPYWTGQTYDDRPGIECATEFIGRVAATVASIATRRIVINTGNTSTTLLGEKVYRDILLDAIWVDALLQHGWLLRYRRIWAKYGPLARNAPESDLIDDSCESLLTFYRNGHNEGGQERIDEAWAQAGYWADVPPVTKNDKSHPCPFPIELVNRYAQLYSTTNDIIFDPFVGSGTTIVACQNLGRKCRAIEISPPYCAVTLERMATAFPGIEIERIE